MEKLLPQNLDVEVGNVEVKVDQSGFGYVKVDGENVLVNAVSIKLRVGKRPIVMLSVVPGKPKQ